MPSPRSVVTDVELVAFLQRVLPRIGMRWSGFRRVRGQVRKRLARRVQGLGLGDLGEYEAYLGTHPGEWDVLDGLCRITISRFYRDRAVFDALRDPILPDLARSARDRGERTLRAWSVGCASGEEPYTLSMCWAFDASEGSPGVALEVVATEVDAVLLERARRACYGRGSLRELPSEWIDRAFDVADGTLCLRPYLRHPVRFLPGDVRQETPDGPFDLVLCRNLVFTYFTPSLQAVLLERILRLMGPAAVLVLGSHESLPQGRWPLERPLGALPIHRLSMGSQRPKPAGGR
ncbi:MAG TPA: CheR family methyltransferase [Longimicrobiales bacterium]|nr:CheR family methyltransferase [Longimicrobiales bacterium]